MATQRKRNAKVQALSQHGALNRHPDAVLDELFHRHDFFDPLDLVQVKYEMLRRVQMEDQTVCHAAATFGFSRLSFYQARAAFEAGGLPGLVPKKRGPHGPHKVTQEVIAFLRQTQARDPTLRPTDLAELLWQTLNLRVHPRTIERALARQEKKRL